MPRTSFFSKISLYLIGIYQRFLSPLWPARCRFYPSCSTYVRQAIERYGAWRGFWIGLKRILKCHPFHPGGVDELGDYHGTH